METRMKPERQTVPPKPFPAKMQEESERWRLRHFLVCGFQDYIGKKCTTYHVRCADGVGEEQLFPVLKEALGGREIPAIIPEAARGRTLEMFRKAEEAGLVSLSVACVSERA